MKKQLLAFFLLALVIAEGSVPSAIAQQAVSPCVRNALGGCGPVETYVGLPTVPAGVSFTNITTNTDTDVKSSAGVFVGLVVNTGGTTSTAAVYDDGDGTCSSDLIGTFDTTALASLQISASVANGICVTTAGGAAADITILWR